MPRSNNQLIKLDTFSDWHDEAKGVEIQSSLNLPEYIPVRNIGVDVDRIASLARLGNLESVRIGLYSAEDETAYSVTGIDSDGSATAGKVSIPKEPRSISSVSHPASRPLSFPPGRGVVKINVEHSELRNDQLRKAEPWAKLLDKGIRDGMKQASKVQLLEPRSDRTTVFVTSKVVNGILATIPGLVVGHPELIPVIFSCYLADDAADISRRFREKITKKERKYDWESSLLVGLPYDRYFAVKALATTRKIIRPI